VIKSLKSTGLNVWLLVFAQGLSMTTLNINIIIVGLAGLAIAPEPWLATLPLSLQFVASMLTTLPASIIMGKIGRRPVFLVGILLFGFGMTGLGVSLISDNFLAFAGSSVLVGMAHGINQFYRYAATDSVEESQKPVVLSLVLAGGLAAAVLGGTIVKNTINLYPETIYAGCFFAAAAMQIIAFAILFNLNMPRPEKQTHGGRPLSAFFRMPRFLAGLVAASLGFAVMSFMMTAAPLQIVSVSKLSDAASATVIQWHVVAMFAPSFFTGLLIRRYTVQNVMVAGLILYAASIAIALNGFTFWHYFIVLVLIGGGWNALYVGGSSIVAAIAAPRERAKVQGVADFIITFWIATASLSAGAMHYLFGWQLMSKLVMIPIVITLGMIVLMVMTEKRAAAAA
jgi:MFS family permease